MPHTASLLLAFDVERHAAAGVSEVRIGPGKTFHRCSSGHRSTRFSSSRRLWRTATDSSGTVQTHAPPHVHGVNFEDAVEGAGFWGIPAMQPSKQGSALRMTKPSGAPTVEVTHELQLVWALGQSPTRIGRLPL